MFPSIDAAVTIRRILPHGHVAAGLGTLRSLDMVRIFGRKVERMRDLVIAAIVTRVTDPVPPNWPPRGRSRRTQRPVVWPWGGVICIRQRDASHAGLASEVPEMD